ncbi:hypothetical protein CRG98_021807 [Punica granatum]|uniref:Uncharacterized protein n=1 Tax=Punica granatum TaxID=22663 RepID=A0A2I0JPE4_PUNGR|nr:hypothetical protein CRG98_021807 [Punica granatum]
MDTESSIDREVVMIGDPVNAPSAEADPENHSSASMVAESDDSGKIRLFGDAGQRASLHCFLAEFISPDQSAFVKGKTIGDNILMAHELVKGYQRERISPRCTIKADVMKAFDSVHWDFVANIFEAINMPSQFTGWVKELTDEDCRSLVYKITQRIDSWASRKLSYAGRLQLIQSVIHAVMNFWCNAFVLPKKVVRAVERKCKVYLWKGKEGDARGAKELRHCRGLRRQNLYNIIFGSSLTDRIDKEFLLLCG